MTVASNINQAQFLGSGSSGPFTFDFRFFFNSEIKVIKTDGTGYDTELVEGEGYELTGAGSLNGGAVTLSNPLAPLEGLTVIRTLPLLQETSIRNLAAFFPEVHEDTFDRLVMMIQQVAESASRAIKMPASASGDFTVPGGPRAGKVLGFDPIGAPELLAPPAFLYSPHGPWVDASQYGTLAEADTAAVAAGKLLVISEGYSVPVAATLNADVLILPGGYIDVAGALNVNGAFTGCFNCLRGSGSVVGLKEATPELFGAVAGGVVECSAAIQKAVNAAKVTTAKSGVYRCDTPILLGTGKTLVVDGELKRITAYSASTRPVVIINNAQLATIRGDGGITTQNACPQGVVLIGPEDPTVNGNQTINNEWNKVLGVSITGGSTAAGNIGVKMQCTNGWSGDKVAYMNKIAVNEIHTCGTGIHLGAECNGNFIHEFSGWNIGQYGIRFAGADGIDIAHGGVNAVISLSDNVVQGAITHASPTLVATLYCESAYANKFNGMHGEPGSGKLYHFDVASNHNVLFGMENHPNLGTDLGTLNTIITDKMFKTNTPCFFATNSASDANVTGDGTTYQIICDNEIKDKTSNYDTGAGGFTAPVTGQYRFTGNVYLTGLGAAHTSIIIRLVTSNRTYLAFVETVGSQPRTSLSQPWSVEADLDAGDTAFVTVQVSGSGATKTVNVFGGASPTTTFAGSMIL